MEKILNQILSEIKGLKQGQENTNERLNHMDKQLDGMDNRFDLIDKRLDGMDERFDLIDKRLNGAEERFEHMDKRLDNIEKKIDAVYEQTAVLTEFKAETNARLNSLESRTDNIERRLDDIEERSADRHAEIISELTGLRKDFTIMEAVTGKNMTDIAHLKSIK